MNGNKMKQAGKSIWGVVGAITLLLFCADGYAQTKLTNAQKIALAKKKKAAQQQAANKHTVGQVISDIQKKESTPTFQKKSAALPFFTPQTQASEKVTAKPLSAVMPPRSLKTFKSDNPDENRLESVVDQEVNQLYSLAQRYSKSANRGELWLRLAELYVEKSRLLEFRSQNEYDKKLTDWEKAGRKGGRPHLDVKLANVYNHKAIKLYEWFAKDFPNDRRVDQALFFLGYNYFELNDTQKGEMYYKDLTTRFPKSPYVSESHFALGEYYFENEKWAQALTEYTDVIRDRESRVRSFAAYKSAWCHYRMGKVNLAMKTLESVIRAGQILQERQGINGKNVGRIRLGSEALRDLVLFYSEVGDYEQAQQYLAQYAKPNEVPDLMEKLAYLYADSGRRKPSAYIFGQLLQLNPLAPKAFDYQLQIVNNYSAAGDEKTYRAELYKWVQDYGANSEWYKANIADKKLLARTDETREKTLRNYVLQLHQNAQNSRIPAAQTAAADAYAVYLANFTTAPQVPDMHFYYGELLYDMKRYAEAGDQYTWVVENAPKSKHAEESLMNSLIASERSLPKEAEVRDKIGDSQVPQELGPNELKFIQVANKFTTLYPKNEKTVEIKFKIGRLYYTYNHFDEALVIFQSIVKAAPKSKSAVYAANLILDIYNIRKDYDGLAKAGQDLMATPGLQTSDIQMDVNSIVEKARFKKASDLEASKDFAGAGDAFQKFAMSHPNSKLVTGAYFNAAVDYERANQPGKAVAMYSRVLAHPSNDKEGQSLALKSRQNMAGLLEKTGQYEKAATEYERLATENTKDPNAPNMYFNAAVIWDGLKKQTRAIHDYERYYETNKKLAKSEALFAIGEIYERQQKWTTASKYYERYLEDSAQDSVKVVEANLRIAKLKAKTGHVDESIKGFHKTIAVQRSLGPKAGSIGIHDAAEARFALVMQDYNAYKAIFVHRNPAKQKADVNQKLAALNHLNPAFAEVIKYDDNYYVVASLVQLGLAYDHFVSTILAMPSPAGLPQDKIKEYQAGVEQFVAPLREKAVENFQNAVTKSRELEAYSPVVWTALDGIKRLKGEVLQVDLKETLPVRETDLMGI